MAKVLITGRDTRPIRLQPHVRDIRARYARALQLGYAPIDAARLANGEEEITKPVRTAAELRPIRKKLISETSKQTAEITGQASTPPSRDNIPPNWPDLPWPQLRELASKISGRNIRSRTDAAKIIEDYLQPPTGNP